MKSGQSDYVNNKLQEIIKKLETYIARFDLDKLMVDKTTHSYLIMSEMEIAKLDKELLAIGEIKLNAYALNIQLAYNKSLAIISWAENAMKLIIASTYNDYDKFIKFEDRKYLVSLDNNYAKRLLEIINEYQLKVQEIQFLSQSIQKVADSFGKLARVRNMEK
jgi:hypothetical protein